MTFRDAILDACRAQADSVNADPLLAGVLKTLEDTPPRHKRFWVFLEHAVARHYERETGKRPPADWKKILDWLIANLPAILKIILALLPFII